MSLLLDALKSSDSNAAAAFESPGMEPHALEPEEEPLDARATLNLLNPPLTPGTLVLEPTPDIAAAGMDTADKATAALALSPQLVAETASPPLYSRPPLTLVTRAPGPAVAPPDPAAPAVNARPTAATATSPGPTMAAPSSLQRTKKYALSFAILVALGGIGMVGKTLLWHGTPAATYPKPGDTQQPAASVDGTPTPASTPTVQVPSERPADQFAYAGNAPEIDLADPGARPNGSGNARGEAGSTGSNAIGDAGRNAVSETGRSAATEAARDPAGDATGAILGGQRNTAPVGGPRVAVPPPGSRTAARTPGLQSAAPSPGLRTAVPSPSRRNTLALPGLGTAVYAAAVASGSMIPATLSVTRSEGPSSIDRHVLAGYQALGSGNTEKAQSEYLAALALDPNNVDALMGSATAAARDGRSGMAAAAYAKVLKLEPGNPDATAATAMLRSGGAPNTSSESHLKVLIAGGDGNRPGLHAALAGVYAADARWTEAAQEYFTALGKDPGNPDLAFNLAASLDQNRNTAMALTYYRQALEFARQRPAQLDLHAVEQRIGQLQAHVGQPALAAQAP
jgi:Flp pilus assembly protein TadD